LAGKDSVLARSSKRMSRICATNPVPALGRLVVQATGAIATVSSRAPPSAASFVHLLGK
jgi:hypothetical protein